MSKKNKQFPLIFSSRTKLTKEIQNKKNNKEMNKRKESLKNTKRV